MCWEFEATTFPVAKKHYHCEASDWLNNCQIDECDLTDDERLSVEGAKADGWKILPGQQYIQVRGKWEGEWQTFRARIDIDAICQRHNIYEC